MWKNRANAWVIPIVVFGLIAVSGVIGSARIAMASDISVFCTTGQAKTAKASGPAGDWVCAAFLQEVAAVHPKAGVRIAQDAAAADVILETRSGPGFSARLLWQGKAPGPWTSTIIRGRAMDDDDLVSLIRLLLQESPRP